MFDACCGLADFGRRLRHHHLFGHYSRNLHLKSQPNTNATWIRVPLIGYCTCCPAPPRCFTCSTSATALPPALPLAGCLAVMTWIALQSRKCGVEEGRKKKKRGDANNLLFCSDLGYLNFKFMKIKSLLLSSWLSSAIKRPWTFRSGCGLLPVPRVRSKHALGPHAVEVIHDESAECLSQSVSIKNPEMLCNHS